jgi:hypothetical protein
LALIFRVVAAVRGSEVVRLAAAPAIFSRAAEFTLFAVEQRILVPPKRDSSQDIRRGGRLKAGGEKKLLKKPLIGCAARQVASNCSQIDV